MQNYDFLDLVTHITEEFLAKWIYGITVKHVDIPPQMQSGDSYDHSVVMSRHCIRIRNQGNYVFNKPNILDSIERPIIDWSLGIAYEYYEKKYDFEDVKALFSYSFSQKIIPYLITANDSYGLNNPWKQYSKVIEYCGDTAKHYGDHKSIIFSEEESSTAKTFYDVLKTLEKLNYLTNEGSKINFTCCFIKGDKTQGKMKIEDILSKQYLKVLSEKNIAIYINEMGEIFDIQDISQPPQPLSFTLSNLTCGNQEEHPHDISSKFIINTINDFQDKNPDKSIVMPPINQAAFEGV